MIALGNTVPNTDQHDRKGSRLLYTTYCMYGQGIQTLYYLYCICIHSLVMPCPAPEPVFILLFNLKVKMIASLTFLVLFLHLITAHASSLSRPYGHGPVSFDETADFFFTINRTSQTAHLALRITDPTLVTDAQNWLAIGISEPTSGSMIGSDLVTAQFSPSQTDRCVIKDRYVPFSAYPLGEQVNQSASVFPVEDDCQDDGSWILLNCQRNVESGVMLLEVSRSLTAHDTQDRDISPGINPVIYAYGDAFGYHSGRRASRQVEMYQSSPDQSVTLEQPPLPDDIDGHISVASTDYVIPSFTNTIYACTSHIIPLKKGEQRMIVAAEHFSNSTNDMVHHILLHLCSGEEYAKSIRKTAECTSNLFFGVANPQNSEESQCTTLVFVRMFFNLFSTPILF